MKLSILTYALFVVSPMGIILGADQPDSNEMEILDVQRIQSFRVTDEYREQAAESFKKAFDNSDPEVKKVLLDAAKKRKLANDKKADLPHN
jgi:hypothetical protein